MPLPKMPSVIILSATKTALRRRKTYPTAFTAFIRSRAGTAGSFCPILMCILQKTADLPATLPTTAILRAISRSSRWMPKPARLFRWQAQASGFTARTVAHHADLHLSRSDHHRHILHEQRGLSHYARKAGVRQGLFAGRGFCALRLHAQRRTCIF